MVIGKNGSGPVLVPVDFSAHSEAALLWAAAAARDFDAPVHVLHVVHDPGSTPGYYSANPAARDDGAIRRLEEHAAEMLEAFLERVRTDHAILADVKELSSELVVGLPASRILEAAERVGARLIVMGSQGRTGLAHLLLGSNSGRVVQLSPIPVTIVKAPAETGGPA